MTRAYTRFIWQYLLILSLSLCYSSTWAQNYQQLKGQWKGYLTQDEGGYADQYSFELYFSEIDGVLKGRTYVDAPGAVGIFTFEGQIVGGNIVLFEKKIVYSQKPEEMLWCFKTMNVKLINKKGQWHLEGYWSGRSNSNHCIPGKIFLSKVTPQA